MTPVGWLSIVVALLLVAAPAASDLQRFEAVEPHMGTLVRIVVYAPDADAARAAHRAGFDRIRHLDQVLSDYRPDSELNRLTAAEPKAPMVVSPDLYAVLRAAQDLAHATDGAFDITQGPVIRLWREARRTGQPPDALALASASARTGFGTLRLDDATRSVTLGADGMALDLGGIGKGYAASEALLSIRAAGIPRALVAVSGDIACGDAPPGRDGWHIGVHSGEGGSQAVEQVMLSGMAISTSGNSAQFVEIDGRRHSHIIDPSTRTGLTDDLVVTVIAPHGVEADSLATAVSVLGVGRGLALVESRPGVAAIIAVLEGGRIRVHRSTRAPRASVEEPQPAPRG